MGLDLIDTVGYCDLQLYPWSGRLSKVEIFGKWVLREDVGVWILPDYKEIAQGQK